MRSKADGLSISEDINLPSLRKLPSQYLLQGNLPPSLMETNYEDVRKVTTDFLNEMNNDSAHILSRSRNQTTS